MGYIGISLFFSAFIVISYRKQEYMCISKKMWLSIGYVMFSTAFLFFAGEAWLSGRVAFHMFDIPFIPFNFTRDEHPMLFYLGATGVALVGIVGWVGTFKELFHKN